MIGKSVLVIFISVLLSPVAFAQYPSGFWQNPTIKSAGSVHPLSNSAFQPDKSSVYKVLFVINDNGVPPEQGNDGRKYVALAVNAFASAGVPTSHLKFVVIVRDAVPAVSDNAQFKKHFHTDNPNLALIHELEASGMQIFVCGQAVAGYGYDYGWIDPTVKVALSGLSTMIILQTQGYVLIQL